MNTQKHCIVCNAIFIDNSPNQLRRWCSMECKNKFRREKVRKKPVILDKICKTCGQSFIDTTKHKRQSFCSISCYKSSLNKNPDEITTHCQQCNIIFQDSTKGKNKKFCSPECKRNFTINKVKHNLRSRLYAAICGHARPESSISLFGCTVTDLIKHIESLWQPGMGWYNYGKNGWHIDHIKPLSLFDLLDLQQRRLACHYSNLQPLWALDNLQKGNKYVEVDENIG